MTALRIPRTGFRSTGWSSAASAWGGRRSYGIEATRLECTPKYPQLAGILPEFHQVRSWKRPTPPFTAAHNQDRRAYEYPPEFLSGELSLFQAQQLLLNLHHISSQLGFMAAADDDPYVGRVGQFEGFAPISPFTSKIDFSPRPNPSYSPTSADPRSLLPSRGQNAFEFLNVTVDDLEEPGQQWRNLRGVQGATLEGHFAYSLYFDAATDLDITRYWRNFLISKGCLIDPEPPHASAVVVPSWALVVPDGKWDDET